MPTPTFTFTSGTAVQNTSMATMVTVTPAADSLLIVVAFEDTGDEVGHVLTASASGLDFEVAVHQDSNGSIYVFTAPIVTSAAHTIGVTSSAGNVRKDVTPIYVTCSDGTIPRIGATDVNIGTGEGFDLTATAAGSQVVMACFSQSTDPADADSQTTLRQAAYVEEGVAVYVQDVAATAAGDTLSVIVNGNYWSAVAFETIPGLSTGVSGTASLPLGGVSVTATGTPANIVITGTAALSLGALTVAASGSPSGGRVSGTASVSLGAVTITASGSPGTSTVTGTASVALGAVTVAASGTAGSSSSSGTAALGLGAVSVTASGAPSGGHVILFEPPTRTMVTMMGYALRYSYQVSETVWKDADGTWQHQESPPSDLLLDATTLLAVGGRPQIVDADTAAELTDAGIGTLTSIRRRDAGQWLTPSL